MNGVKIPGSKVAPLKPNDEILIDFDCVVDIDIGIYKYLLENFRESKFFNYNFKSIRSDSAILQEVLFRKEINPIYAILDPSQDISDDEVNKLLKDILSDPEAYDSVLEFSPRTDICSLMNIYVNSKSGINVTVLCRNEKEVKVIKNINQLLRTTTLQRGEIDSTLYNAYFVKYYMNILEFKKFSGNQIYIMEYKFNMDDYEKKIPIRPLSYVIKDTNKIKTVAPYINPNLPKG